MLELVEASHFAQLQGRSHSFQTPDGNTLMLRVDSVTLKPKSQMPGNDNGRMPFTVNLCASEPTRFIEGLCAIELPDIGRVQNIMVSRQAALGRDPQHAYFQIMFN